MLGTQWLQKALPSVKLETEKLSWALGCEGQETRKEGEARKENNSHMEKGLASRPPPSLWACGVGKGHGGAGYPKGIRSSLFQEQSLCRLPADQSWLLIRCACGWKGQRQEGCPFVLLKRDYELTDQVSSVICVQKPVL